MASNYKGSVKIPSGLSRMGTNYYPLVDGADININTTISTKGVDKKLTDILDEIETLLNTEPTLTYVNEEGYREGDKKYWAIGEQMNLKFNFTSPAAGACTVTILRNGFTFKTVSVAKGLISIDLGVATTAEMYTYTVSVQDSRGNTAHDEEGNIVTLIFTQILGGVTITSNFDTSSAKTVYTAGTTNTISVPASITYAETGEGTDRQINYTITDLSTLRVVVDSFYTPTPATENWSGTFEIKDVNLPTAGNYSLKLVGLVNLSDSTTLLSGELLFYFNAIENNSVAILVLDTNIASGIQDTDSLYITYRISTNNEAAKSALEAKCQLYRIYNDDRSTKVLIKTITQSNLVSGDSSTWNIGRLSSLLQNYSYLYEIHGLPIGGGTTADQYAEDSFTVKESSSHGNEYVTDGLLAYFDPNDKDNADSDPSTWKMHATTEPTSNYYYFKLHDLNYSSNGWVKDDEDGSKMLKFTGDSYGELRYVDANGNDSAFAPMSLMSDGALGNTVEIMCRTRCIGVTDAVVMSCKRLDIASYGGYSLSYDNAIISSNQEYASTSMVEDEWVHVVFVIDKNLRQLNGSGAEDVSNTDIENMNPVKTMNIYINGVRTKVISMPSTDISGDFVSNSYPAVPLTINAFYNYVLSKMSGFGNCEIKTVRLYNRALKASEIITNYINANYSTEKREELITKNDTSKANIPVVHFVRNCVIENNEHVYGQLSADKSFAVLNSITVKSSKDPSVPTSKNSWVNCTMWYTYLDEETGVWKTKHYHDVDVYLQGTSSLQYPVKNYKIKMFKTKDGATSRDKTKNKIIPPNKIATYNGEEYYPYDGWHTKDSVYTLKCDYMEESHKNNTPTAMLYEKVVDTVISDMASADKVYTPAKDPNYADYNYTYKEADEQGEEVEKTVRKYRDAVAGFPILLYYNDNNAFDSDGNALDYNELSSEELGYYDSVNDTMVGSLMFNVDKTGKALGFEVGIEDLSEAQDRILGVKEVTDSEGTKYLVTSPLDIDKEVGTRKTYKYVDGSDVEIDCLPCTSIEGTSNSAVPSAASFFTMEEANLYLYENDYLDAKRLELYPDCATWELVYSKYFSSKYTTYEEFYEAIKAGEISGIQSFEAFKNDSSSKAWHNEYDYILGTFETRWAYTDEVLDLDDSGDIISTDDYNEMTYGPVLRTLEWFASVAALTTEDAKKAKFRNEFRNYFSFAYAMVYYLQMQAFIQVDNAGKNAMFDQWGDGKWYLRPYDMDTLMGENNSGDDTMHASAEINRDLSPSGITGNLASQANVSNLLTDPSHDRYNDYNTPNSRLWNYFGQYFKEEIQNVYTYLRDSGVYTTEYIVDYVNSITTDIIGESFYNKDASSKYLTQTKYYEDGGVPKVKDDMLTKLLGNRYCRYMKISEDRFKFLDTFFSDVSTEGTINTSINLRSDAASTGVYTQQIGISVYSPCYVKVVVGTDVTIVAYIDTDETYTYNETEYEGVLFTLPLLATNKDITILGAGNIKAINHMDNLLITHFDCANASKLTEINITGSTMLASLSLGSNTYLRNLNVNSCKNLGGSLNLTNCTNLQYLNFADTAVVSVLLPENGALSTFIATNSKITALEFRGLVFLKSDSSSFNIDGCTSVVSFIMTNCPNIEDINVSGYTNLLELTVSNCSGIQKLELSHTKLQSMNITSCSNLNSIDLSYCSGTIMTNLNLASIYGLKTLNISNATPSSSSGALDINVYLPQYKEEYSSEEARQKAPAGTDFLWHALQYLNCSGSNFAYLNYGITTGTSGDCDFSQLTELKTLILSSCNKIKKVIDISYSGNLAGLFYLCRNLSSITGTLTATNSSANSLFYRCYALSGLSSVTLNLNTIALFSAGMENMTSATLADLLYVLSCLPNVTDLSSVFSLGGVESGHSSTVSFTSIPNDLFVNNTKVTNLSYFFRSRSFTYAPASLLVPMQSTLRDISYMFFGCSSLLTVDNTIFKNCELLSTIDYLFYGCSKLKTLFGSDYDLFAENNLITSAKQAFEGCSQLSVSTITENQSSGLKTLFDHLTKLSEAQRMFAGCSFITGIPVNVFEKATNLSNIDMMFMSCSNLTNIPTGNNSLFNSDHVLTHPLLKYARGLFCNCTKLSSPVGRYLLVGANNLEYIGHGYDPLLWRQNYYCAGMFANTKIDGYDYRFLEQLTKLKSVSTLFFHGSISGATMVPTTSGNNNDALVGVYNDNNRTFGLYNDLLSSCTSVNDTRGMFAGNHALTKFLKLSDDLLSFEEIAEPTMFVACYNSITNAADMFANCDNLAFDVPSTMFLNCKSLSTITGIFAGCHEMTGSLSSQMFSGCTSLAQCGYAFYDCLQLGSNDVAKNYSIPAGLFDSCRTTLTNVAHMFENCGFGGKFELGEVTTTTDPETGAIIYTIIKHGLLSECTGLVTTEGMFRNCHTLHGAIPQDIFFTPIATSQYLLLTNISYMFDGCYALGLKKAEDGVDPRNPATIYGELHDEDQYFVPTNWLQKLPNITDVRGMFRHASCLTSSSTSYETLPLTVSTKLFSSQNKITYADYMFACTKAFAAALNAEFMQESLNYLKTVTYMFALSNLKSAGTSQYHCLFEKTTTELALNKTLTNVNYVFSKANSNLMTGWLPDLETKFGAIENTLSAYYHQSGCSNFSSLVSKYPSLDTVDYSQESSYIVTTSAFAASIPV